MIPNKTNIKHVYILAPKITLINNFAKEIFYNYSEEGEYDISEIEKLIDKNVKTRAGPSSSRKIRKTEVTAILEKLSDYYTIVTYNKFAKDNKTLSDEQLKEKYSNCYFILEEVHSMRLKEDPFRDYAGRGEEKAKRIKYRFYHKLFHMIESSKVIALSFTPMVNKSKEIAFLMNLLLPLDNQMPVDYDYDDPEFDDLSQYYNGYISYIREEDTGVDIKYSGKKINRIYDIGNNSYKSQKKIHKLIMPDIEDDDENDENDGNDEDEQNLKQYIGLKKTQNQVYNDYVQEFSPDLIINGNIDDETEESEAYKKDDNLDVDAVEGEIGK